MEFEFRKTQNSKYIKHPNDKRQDHGLKGPVANSRSENKFTQGHKKSQGRVIRDRSSHHSRRNQIRDLKGKIDGIEDLCHPSSTSSDHCINRERTEKNSKSIMI